MNTMADRQAEIADFVGSRTHISNCDETFVINTEIRAKTFGSTKNSDLRRVPLTHEITCSRAQPTNHVGTKTKSKPPSHRQMHIGKIKFFLKYNQNCNTKRKKHGKTERIRRVFFSSALQKVDVYCFFFKQTPATK